MEVKIRVNGKQEICKTPVIAHILILIDYIKRKFSIEDFEILDISRV